MRCSEFLSGFSDFRDGRLPADASASFASHREACASCARYEKTLEAGLDILRSARIEPREDFRPRLQHSIYTVDEQARRRTIPRGTNLIPVIAMAAIAIAVIFAPSVWSPEPVAELAPIVANAPTSTSSISVPVTGFDVDASPSLGSTPLWAESNTLLYEYSSLNARYREPTLVRTDLR